MPSADIIILLTAAASDKEVAKMLISGNIDIQEIRKTLKGVDETILPEDWTLTEEEIGNLKNIKAPTLVEFVQKTIESGLLTNGPASKEIEK